MEDKLQKLHDILVSKEIDNKSFDEFKSNFSDNPDKQKKLHDILVSKGIDNKSFEEFQNNFFNDVKKKDQLDLPSLEESSESTTESIDLTDPANQDLIKKQLAGFKLPEQPTQIEGLSQDEITLANLKVDKKLGLEYDPETNRYTTREQRMQASKNRGKQMLVEEVIKRREGEMPTNKVDNVLKNQDEKISMMDKRYNPELDINDDGVIDVKDSEVLNNQEEERVKETKGARVSPREFVEETFTELDAKKEAQKSDDIKREEQRLDIATDQDYLGKIDTLDGLADTTAEGIRDYVNTNFGVNGFIAQAYGGDKVQIADVNGNTIMVDYSDLSDIKNFLANNAINAKDEADMDGLSNAQKKAVKFYAERGLNYYGVNAAQKNYQAKIARANLIEELIANPAGAMKFSRAQKEKYPELFYKNKNGIYVPYSEAILQQQLNKTESQIEKLSDVVGQSWNDQQIFDTNEEFDKYMQRESDIVSARAAEVNKKAKADQEIVFQAVQDRFGKPFEEIKQEDIKTRADYVSYMDYFDRIKAVEFAQKDAADKYLDAQTYFDAKFDKSINEKSLDNWKAVQASVFGGIDRSQAGYEILAYAMGITPDDDMSKEEVAELIASNLMQAENRGGSAAMNRFMKARGFSESAAAFFNDPFEIMASAVADSLSQLLVYGSAITASTTVAGATVGGVYGSVVPGVGTVGGAIAGGVKGFRAGMALSMFAMEYNNAIIDAARNQGYEITNPQDWEKALGDEAVWDEGMEVGLKRGIPIAVIDYLTAGLAGKTFGTATRAFSSPVKRLSMIATEQGIYGPGAEMLGEFAAQVSAGQEVDAKEIILEGIGGFGNNSINLAWNTAKITNKNAKLNLAEELTDVKNVMNESASNETIMKFANNMRKTGQIDEMTYQQIEENVSARRTAEQYIETGNPDLIVQEEVQTEVETKQKEKAVTEEGAAEAVTTEAGQEAVQETEADQTVKAETSIFEDINKAFTRKKRKDAIKNRIAELVKVRNNYQKDSETSKVFSKKISEINNEISQIIETGKLPEQQIQLPQLGQVYKVKGRFGKPRNLNARQFKKYLETVSDKKFENHEITVKNPTPEIQTLLDNKYKQLNPDAVQKQETGDISDAQPTKSVQKVEEEVRITPQETKESKVKIITKPAKDVKTKKAIPPTELSGKQKTNRENLVERVIKKGLKEGKSNKEIVEDVSLKITLDEASKKEVEKFVASRKAGITEETFTEWNSAEVVQEVVQEEVAVDQETEAAIKAEAEILKQALGITQTKKKGKTRFEVQDETQVEDEANIKEIEEAMNKMSQSQLDFQEPTTEGGLEVKPVSESKISAEEKAANLKELGRTEEDLMVDLKDFDNTPTIMAMSDVLATGKSLKDSQGNNIDVRGGLMYNIFGPNKNLAWAGVDFEGAQQMVDNAVKIYKNNEEYFKQWWKKNPQYDGMVPLSVMRMADSAIYSNEATFRWINPTIKKYSLEARTEAFNEFVKDLDKPVKGKKLIKAKKDFKAFLKANPDIKTIDELIDAVSKDSQERAKKKTKEDATAEAGHLPLDSKKYLFDKIFSPTNIQKAGNKLIAKTLNKVDPQPDNKSKFSEKLLLEDIGEPAMMKSKKGDLMGFMGIDVLNPGVEKANHQNYGWGPRGKVLGLLNKPTNGINVFPEFFAKASRVFKAEIEQSTGKEKGLPSKKKVRDQVGGAFFIDNAFKGARVKAGEMTDIEIISAKMRYAFPQVNVITNQKEFNKKINEPGVITRKVKGKVILGLTKDGQIYINPNKATIATPIHEFGHIWIDFLRSTASGKKGTALLKKGMELVKNTPYYEKAKNTYGEFDENGNLTNEELVLEEALVEGIANKGENIAKASQKSKFKSWLNGMFKYIQEKFTTSTDTKLDAIKELNLEEFQNIALADLFAGTVAMDKASNLFDPAFESGTTAKARFEILGGLSVEEIISKGRERGFTEASIKEVIKDQFPEMSVESINEKMAFNLENNQLNVFSKNVMPESFGNVEGGLEAGQEMYNDISRELRKFARQGNKTQNQLVNKAMSILKGHPTYKAQRGNTTLQKQLQVDLESALNLSPTKSLKQQFATLKKQINQRKLGRTEAASVVKRIESMLRQNLPSTELTVGERNAVLKILKDAKPEEFDAAVNKALELTVKIENRLKNKAINKLARRMKTLAAVTKQSGKPKSKGKVDADGISFFKAASRVLAAVTNKTEAGKKAALERIQNKLFLPMEEGGGLNPELERVADKVAAGQEITSSERDLLSLYSSYELLKNIDKMSYQETMNLVDQLGNVESAARLSLQAKLMQRAQENRALREGAQQEIESTYGDEIFSGESEFVKANREVDYTYKEKVLEQWDGNPDSEVEVDGKVFKVESKTLKNGQEKTTLFVQQKKLKTQNQLAEEWTSLRQRVLLAKQEAEATGKNKTLARIKANWDQSVEFAKQFKSKSGLKFITQLASNSVSNLATMMRNLDTSKNKFFETKVYRNLNRMRSASLKGYQSQIDHMDSIANEITGTKDGMQAIQKVESQKVVQLTLKGNKKLNLFGTSAMRLYALSKNEVQRDKLKRQGFTEETFNQIESQLDPQSKELVDRTVEYLSDSYFETVNNVYEDVNFVSMDKQENYFPTKTDMTNSQQQNLKDAIVEGDFQKAFSAQYASALKTRTDIKGEVQIKNRDGSEIGFFSELNSHFREMEKFKAYAPGVKEINTIFSDPSVNAAMTMNGNKGLVYYMMNYAVNPQAVNDVVYGNRNWLSRMFSLYTTQALGFRPIQLLKQASSMIAAFEVYESTPGQPKTIKDIFNFSKDLAVVLSNPMKYINMMKEASPEFRERLSNKDIAALEGFEARPAGKKWLRKLQEAGGFFTRAGDIMGVLGYAAAYKRDIENGVSKQKAVEKFEDYNETQQSRRPQDMNYLQANQNVILRATTMFGSTAMLMANALFQTSTVILRSFNKDAGAKNWYGFKDVPARTWRKFFLQGSLVNAAFFAAGNFLRFGYGDDKDKEEALKELGLRYMLPVTTFETAFPILGPSIGYAADIATGENPFKAAMRRKTAVAPIIDNIVKYSGKNTDYGWQRATLDIVPRFLGVNVDPALSIYDYFKDDEFNERDLSRIFGIGSTATPESIEDMGDLRALNFDGYRMKTNIEESDVFKTNMELKKQYEKERKDAKRRALEKQGVRSF